MSWLLLGVAVADGEGGVGCFFGGIVVVLVDGQADRSVQFT